MTEPDVVVPSSPRKRSRLVISVAGSLIVLLLVLGVAGTVGAGGWSNLAHRHGEAFTALSFSEPSKLPIQSRPGEEITFSYTVTNHRPEDAVVEETVNLLTLPGDSNVWQQMHSGSVPAGSSDVRTIVVRMPLPQNSVTGWRLEIRLASGEEIYHVIRRIT